MEPGDVILAGRFLAQSKRSKGESSALQKLKMTSCNSSEDFWRKLFLHLSICKKLTHLIVSRNSMGGAGWALPYSILKWGDDPPLQVLQMDQCLMPEDTWIDLFESLSRCKHITHLDLSYNRLGEAGSVLSQAMSDWGDQPPLQKLDFSYCSMSPEACGRLFFHLISCKSLTYLDLSGNMVGEAGQQLAQAIESWGDDPPLETFIAEHCFIPTTVWPGLLISLSPCRKLNFLDLSHNILTGCLSSFLPILPCLEEFLLDSCDLNESDLLHLVNCVKLQKIPSLQNLYLNQNRFFRMEDVLGELIESCIDHSRGCQVKLWMQWNILSQGFMNTWIPRCENTNISLDLQLPGSAEKNIPTKVNEIFTKKIVQLFIHLKRTCVVHKTGIKSYVCSNL